MRRHGSITAIVCRVFLLASLAVPATAQGVGAGGPEALLTIEDLISEAEVRNPGLRAARRDLDAARLRIPPAGALPDPVLTFGQMSTGNVASTAFQTPHRSARKASAHLLPCEFMCCTLLTIRYERVCAVVPEGPHDSPERENKEGLCCAANGSWQ